jgi:tetratricopeptide (TPR) repeat protein
VQEVDLSAEWDTLLEESRVTEGAANAPAEEPAAAAKHHAEPDEVEEFRIAEEPTLVPPEEAPAVAAFDTADPAHEIPVEPVPVAESSATTAKEPKKAEELEPEFEFDQEYELILAAEPLVPAYDQKPPQSPAAPPEPVAQNAGALPPAGSGLASDQFLADLASEIDQLGLDVLSPGFSGTTPGAELPTAEKHVSAPAISTESGPLKEVFDEFRAELGEMGADDEDLETHYNLGIAFREMGLLEEAISEFQKVAKASDRGRPFRYTMQCCTLLGLAFIEKGQPAIAAIWYERALLTPDMDPESTLALRYDLGMAQESAGEAEAALKSFSQVYAMNIDYRDVAERIAALQKPSR